MRVPRSMIFMCLAPLHGVGLGFSAEETEASPKTSAFRMAKNVGDQLET